MSVCLYRASRTISLDEGSFFKNQNGECRLPPALIHGPELEAQATLLMPTLLPWLPRLVWLYTFIAVWGVYCRRHF